MKSYTCAKEGRTTEAVSVCAVCGMALCMDHAHEREIDVVQRASGWAGITTMHILCERCSKLPISA